MSTNGNGSDARLIQLRPGDTYRSAPQSVPLSATEREQQQIAYIAAVDAMATTLRGFGVQIPATVKELEARDTRMAQRLDVLERAAAVDRSRTFWQRLRWLVGL